ncbi:hypothetical protein ACFYUY_01720 [Kitasatospora sp. NPDC004745]|uniref:hypothetical protein n=1 Tax=Kitasatospora sp. NPDC004745 TaxID=3364019 RepID=UPI0036ACC79F
MSTQPLASAGYRAGYAEGERTAASDPGLAQRIASIAHLHHPADRAQGYVDAVRTATEETSR